MNKCVCLLWLSCGAVGCSVERDSGRACLAHRSLTLSAADTGSPFETEAPPVISLQPDTPLVATVELGHRSSSTRLLHASCELSRDGSDLELSSLYRTRKPSPISPVVTNFIWDGATCRIGGLPEGEYTLRFGDRSLAFALPSETDDYCVGGAW